MKFTTPLLALTLVGMVACSETAGPLALEPENELFSSAPTITRAPFFPVAECERDIGFNIRFGGERVLLTHTTTDRQGRTHTTEHFRVQDFKGWRMPVPNPPQTAPDFDVQGGAEMFSTHRNADGTIHVRIHQGNLVFRDVHTGQRVIAHHTIRMVPGRDPVNFWSCRLVG